jgi:dTDP-4-amino-4,6-dideoxygalactose transaminase
MKQLKPDDEPIIVTAGFPSTIDPIIQNGLILVFLVLSGTN